MYLLENKKVYYNIMNMENTNSGTTITLSGDSNVVLSGGTQSITSPVSTEDTNIKGNATLNGVVTESKSLVLKDAEEAKAFFKKIFDELKTEADSAYKLGKGDVKKVETEGEKLESEALTKVKELESKFETKFKDFKITELAALKSKIQLLQTHKWVIGAFFVIMMVLEYIIIK